MRLINVSTRKLEEFLDGQIPPYAILSHTWGNDHEEVSFLDIQAGRIDGKGGVKVNGCCAKAEEDGLGYVWIDTCCIDKANSTELGEAINSMFRWYTNADVCYAYLSDVPTDENPSDSGSAFRKSRWFCRGWTLQELIAPKKMRFYSVDWSCLGNKRELAPILISITGIPRPYLLGVAHLREASVAQRMSWAAKRVTKRKEDLAYCLLGIFGVVMPMIYGEEDRAFIRLQEEIMRHVRDDSILAWGLNVTKSSIDASIQDLSDGALATSPSDFVDCSHIVSTEHYGEFVDSLQISGGRLQLHRQLHVNSLGETFILLHCHSFDDTEQVVGVPVRPSAPKGSPDTYTRLRLRPRTLLSRARSSVAPRTIWIHTERQRVPTTDRRYGFYLENNLESSISLVEVEPKACWNPDADTLTLTNETDGVQRASARFRQQQSDSYDFIVLLELEWQKSPPQARHHVMVSSRATELVNIIHEFENIRPEMREKHSASSGAIHLQVATRLELVGKQLMFVVKLSGNESPQAQDATVDITYELRHLELMQKLLSLFKIDQELQAEAKVVDQKVQAKSKELDPMKSQLAKLTTEIETLQKQKQELEARVNAASAELEGIVEDTKAQTLQRQRIFRTVKRVQTVMDDINKSSPGPATRDRSDMRAMIVDQATAIIGPTCNPDIDSMPPGAPKLMAGAIWHGNQAIFRSLLYLGVDIETKDLAFTSLLSLAAARGEHAILLALLHGGADFRLKDKHNQTALFLAASHGHQHIIQVLLDQGADIEDGKGNITPLQEASHSGHEAAVRLLLDRGANIESRGGNFNTTSLSQAALNGYGAVAQLLLDRGADIEAKNDNKMSALGFAACCCHLPLVCLLLDRGADIGAKDNCDRSPLLLAADNGKDDFVSLLLDRGADIEAKDNAGMSSLVSAADRGYKSIVELLLDRGAQIESRDQYNMTALAWAAWRGHARVLEVLLDRGANIDIMLRFTDTPPKDREALVQFLIHRAGDAAWRNSKTGSLKVVITRRNDRT